MTTHSNPARMSASTMKALQRDAVAGNAAAAQVYAAELTASGRFAHLGTPQAQAGMAQWRDGQNRGGFATAEDAAAHVLAAGRTATPPAR